MKCPIDDDSNIPTMVSIIMTKTVEKYIRILCMFMFDAYSAILACDITMMFVHLSVWDKHAL